MDNVIGSITVFKDGKEETYNITLTPEMIEEAKNKAQEIDVQSLTSIEERKLNPNANIFFNPNEIYNKYIENGYSIIRTYNTICFEMGNVQKNKKEKSSIIIPYNISKEDYENLMKKVNNLDAYNLDTYNYINFEYGKEFDYISKITSLKSNVKDFVDIFCKEKLNTLSDEEKKLVEEYRNFNLDNIVNGKCKNNKIHNQDAGVILIDENNTYVKPVNNVQHINSVKVIEKAIGKKNDKEIQDMAKENNQVILCASTGQIIGFMNEDINDYQKNQLLNVLNKSMELNKDLFFTVITLGPDENEISDINDLESYLKGRTK